MPSWVSGPSEKTLALGSSVNKGNQPSFVGASPLRPRRRPSILLQESCLSACPPLRHRPPSPGCVTHVISLQTTQKEACICLLSWCHLPREWPRVLATASHSATAAINRSLWFTFLLLAGLLPSLGSRNVESSDSQSGRRHKRQAQHQVIHCPITPFIS